jgi:LPXTG-motif cell wall-anchored protein
VRKKFVALAALVAAVVAIALVALSQSASAATSTVTQSSGWDFTETRTAGHYQFTSAGLHVWTDDATSQAKVAGYSPPGAISTSLSAVAAGPEPSLNWVGTSPQPGYQLVVSTADGVKILVGEPVYGDKWWMPNSYCNTWCDTLPITYSGGGGSAHSATLDQWSAALDESNVVGIGFSLGSGVKGDGTLVSLTLGDDCYRFGADVVVPPSSTTTTTTTDTSTSTSTETSSPTSGTSSSTDETSTGSSSASATTTGSARFTNCDEVRAAGVAPLYLSDVDYRTDLDSDGDGVACETEATHVGNVGEKGLAYTGTSDKLPIILWIGILAVVVGIGLIFVYRRRSSQSGDHRR